MNTKLHCLGMSSRRNKDMDISDSTPALAMRSSDSTASRGAVVLAIAAAA